MADSKISQLPGGENTNPTTGDGLPFIDDIAGTPVSQYIKYENLFQPPAGTTTRAPITMTPGTLMTTPTDGAIEMDANALYATTDAGNRGVIPVRYIIRADSQRTFTSNTNFQAIFSNPANGSLTLETGTYLFKAFVRIASMSATSGNLKFSLNTGGTAILGGILWHAVGADSANDGLTAMSGLVEVIETQLAANLFTATTATAAMVNVEGTFEVGTAGSIIPAIALTTASAAVTAVGSYFMVERIGATNMTHTGQWT